MAYMRQRNMGEKIRLRLRDRVINKNDEIIVLKNRHVSVSASRS